MTSPALFIFTRDLRIYDNLGLNVLARAGKKIFPMFILAPEQIESSKNPYFSHNSVQFMTDSLKDLDHDLHEAGSRLHVFKEDHEKVLDSLWSGGVHFSEIHCTMDVTNYAKARAEKIGNWCKSKNINFTTHDDLDVLPLDIGLLRPEVPYQKFTPFFRASSSLGTSPSIRKVDTLTLTNKNFVPADFLDKQKSSARDYVFSLDDMDTLYTRNENLILRGGRHEGLQRLEHIKTLKNYDKSREIPSIEGTTRVSAHLKFGTISSREMYWAVANAHSKSNGMIRELFWRGFYLRITYYLPRLLEGRSLKPQYDAIPWRKDVDDFHRWKEGQTGVPLVDAAMRCLANTGWLHNRLRMVVASFLTKNLLLPWQLGERYFAQNLVDYDPAANNGGWQWVASCGADAQPYFRVFNPFLQSQKYDGNAKFIKTWIPELKSVKPEAIHRWNTECKKHPTVSYPAPMVDVQKSAKEAIALFKSVVGNPAAPAAVAHSTARQREEKMEEEEDDYHAALELDIYFDPKVAERSAVEDKKKAQKGQNTIMDAFAKVGTSAHSSRKRKASK